MWGFSCYIWNISLIRSLIPDLVPHSAGSSHLAGGPEVSFDCGEILQTMPQVKGIMRGEGEETFASLAQLYEETKMAPSDLSFSAIDGISFRERMGRSSRRRTGSPWLWTGFPSIIKISRRNRWSTGLSITRAAGAAPFPAPTACPPWKRGCGSAPLSKVLEELDYFLEQKVPQVKFIDRTFNCKKSHAMAIWNHILEKDRGITNFHFGNRGGFAG